MNKRLIKSNDGGVAVPASFNTVTYSGNGGTQSITSVGFAPDLTWIKSRNNTWGHNILDSVRGEDKFLASNTTGAEGTGAGLFSFDTNGFTVNGGGGINENGDTFVAWAWKAGGAAVTNTDGTITSQVSANTEAGFSIVSYTGNLTASTVGHGLSNTPSIYIVKRRDSISNWFVYNENIGNTKYLNLDSTNAAGTFNVWNNTSPTNSVFSLAGQGDVNASGGNYIAYCFAEVEGFSNFGSYVGTGASGNTIVTGFEPAFVMIKRSSAASNWSMFDNKRSPTNPRDSWLAANVSEAEQDLSIYDNVISFTTNGFALLEDGTEFNGNTNFNLSGSTYIYMAFANQF